ncbi:hypothetical protein KIPB_012599, partial [Kipferlia bialata]
RDWFGSFGCFFEVVSKSTDTNSK